MATELNLDRLRQEVIWWLRGHEDRAAGVKDLANTAGCDVSLIHKLSSDNHCNVSVEMADRILIAMTLTWRGTARHPETGRNNKMVIRSSYDGDGRRRQPGETGRIKKVDFTNAKLSERQLRVIYKLHIEGGHSLGKIASAGWEKWGFKSQKSCKNSLCDRLNSIGLKPRARAEQVSISTTTHGMLAKGKSRAAWKRWRRANVGPFPSDGPEPDWEKVRKTGRVRDGLVDAP